MFSTQPFIVHGKKTAMLLRIFFGFYKNLKLDTCKNIFNKNTESARREIMPFFAIVVLLLKHVFIFINVVFLDAQPSGSNV